MYKKHKLSTKTFELSITERNIIEHEKKCYEHSRSAIIKALKVVQKHRGWISDQAIYAIADILNISPSDVESIATFYSGIFRQQVGRHIIRYCDSIVCYITGFQKIQAKIEEELNITPGQTTLDQRFTLLPTSCLGNCDKGPTMMIDEDTYNNLSPNIISNLLEQYK